ncbi:MAG: DEAD/DEAH box helicase family protein [Akkermansia sp.]
MARAAATGKPGRRVKAKAGKIGMQQFHGMLILAQWARSFFQGSDFRILQRALNRRELEGINPESGQTRFFHELMDSTLFNMNRVERITFSRYDKNIVRHWKKISEQRNKEAGRTLEMKYFQYLTLLVTELYLDWFFNHQRDLLDELNQKAREYNQANPKNRIEAYKDAPEDAPVFTEETLRKIAFWEATGAGKTLMLHVNLLQYLEYAGKAGKTPDRIILLTPNEGLSRQHVEEFALSGISAELMSEMGLFRPQGVETVYVVDSVKLISDDSTKKKGEKSFYAQSFEGNNLVLVDEGHHGSSKEDGEHRRSREMLCSKGFSLEYSATFGQAVAGKQSYELRSEYAKSILFDYSYRFFYEDGYGKESFILNLTDDENKEHLFRYLCANLLSYYQQHCLFARNAAVAQRFRIAKPLCIFVGNTVNTEDSDVQQVIGFYADVLRKRSEVEDIFRSLVSGADILRMGNNNPLRGRYKPLAGRSAADIYDDMLRKVFHADYVATLRVCLQKNSGEITLAVGEAEPFGLVTVGDGSQLTNALEKDAQGHFIVQRHDISKDYFRNINQEDSSISILIGSRKFTEGWSSWRVSAMGLLNMGVKEGTQIIQLFGRGVRLRGYNFSLKRSTPEERQIHAKDAFLEYLETLQIFGVRANYMAQFKAYLENEGIQTLDQVLTLQFPIRRNAFPAGLMVPQIKDGYRLNQAKGFKSQEATLFELPHGYEDKIRRIEVTYDDFAYVQMMRTDKTQITTSDAADDVKLDTKAFPYFDWDGIYRELQEEKARHGYWNLSIDKQKLIQFAHRGNGWYKLRTRKEDVTFDSFAKLAGIERLFRILILAYMEQFYKRLQSVYEDEHREMRPLNGDWIPDEYVFEIENTDEGRLWNENLQKLQEIIKKEEVPFREVNQWMKEVPGFVVIAFKQHLYSPLFYVSNRGSLPFTYKPISLGAASEEQFVRDLQTFYNSPAGKEHFENIDLYLMRNATNKLKGIGFAQAGNFYPDFMMWIIDKTTKQQYLTFIDPKGLRNVPFTSPKLNFAEEIKALQKAVNQNCDNPIILNSVILSSTPYSDEILKQHTHEEYDSKHILFLGEDYLPKLFKFARKE